MSRGEKRRTALKNASYRQIAQIAHDAATWYKATLLQCIRFDNARGQGYNDPFDLPWSEDAHYPFVPEKIYLLLAINHTLDYVEDLNIALLSKNDFRLDSAAKKLLDTDDFHNRIKKVRNANEHSIEYLLDVGWNQQEFESSIPTEIGRIVTNSQWYIQIGEDAYIGDINVVGMLNHLRDNRDEIITLLSTIFIDYFGKE